MRRNSTYTLILTSLLFIISCTETGKPGKNDADEASTTPTGIETASGNYLSAVFLRDLDNVFRRVDLDMPLSSVKETESGSELKLADQSDNFLHYEQDLNIDTAKGVDYVEVKYIFDDMDRLDIITVNYYIQDSTITNNLFDDLNRSFNESYGDYYIDSDGYTVWESAYKRGDTLEVAFDVGIRKLVKLNDPGITIEMMRFGAM